MQQSKTVQGYNQRPRPTPFAPPQSAGIVPLPPQAMRPPPPVTPTQVRNGQQAALPDPNARPPPAQSHKPTHPLNVQQEHAHANLFMLTENSNRADLNCYGSPLALKPHQLAVLNRLMAQIENNIKNSHKLGILKDKAGSGKTFCILAFMMAEKMKASSEHRTNIVVVPLNIYTQWKEAIDQINDNASAPLTYTDFTDYAAVASLYHGTLNKYSDILITVPMYSDVIVQACDTARIQVDRIVYDEADSIEWCIREQGRAKFIWFVSASFVKVPRAYADRVESLSPLQIASSSVFCDPTFVDTVWQLPEPKINRAKCTSTYVDVVLRPLLNVEQLERVNAGDYHELPFNSSAKIPTTDKQAVENMVESCETQVAATQPILDQMQTKIKSMGNNPERTAFMEQITSTKQHIEKHQQALDTLNNNMKSVTKHTSSDKLKGVVQILKSVPAGAQAIIYSKYMQTFETLTEMLDDAGIKHCQLDAGTITDIDRIVKKYQKGEIPVFLAVSSLMGAGLNLEMTTDVIFLHKMSAMMDSQVRGRGQRPGRTSKLRVWYMLHDNEIV